jgi:hypothetical protein
MITSVYLKRLEESTMKSVPNPLTGVIGPSKIWIEKHPKNSSLYYPNIVKVIYEYQVPAIHRWFESQHWHLINKEVYYEREIECLSKSI